RARAVLVFDRPWDLAQSQTLGRAGLAVMDGHLADRAWLATDRPTIADIACYPYVALAPMGEVSLADYPNVVRWIGAVQALPGYIDMPGIRPASEIA
ncbi:MAG: glutathione binding-like protein, partial [Alphaproteobacteria bacterium]|nr:glutathione binding-like protein [Alphaproteobacteria bacterium]